MEDIPSPEEAEAACPASNPGSIADGVAWSQDARLSGGAKSRAYLTGLRQRPVREAPRAQTVVPGRQQGLKRCDIAHYHSFLVSKSGCFLKKTDAFSELAEMQAGAWALAVCEAPLLGTRVPHGAPAMSHSSLSRVRKLPSSCIGFCARSSTWRSPGIRASSPSSATHPFCDLGHVTSSSVLFSAKWV